MGKPYVRIGPKYQGKKEGTKPGIFICTKCKTEFLTKVEFKNHWRESKDHDNRRLK